MAPARIPNALSHEEFRSDDDFAPREFFSGERICAPRFRRRRNTVLRVYLAIFVVLAGSWMVFRNPERLETWITAFSAAASSAFNRMASTQPASTPNAISEAAVGPAEHGDTQQQLAALPASEVHDAPGVPPSTAEPLQTTDATEAAATEPPPSDPVEAVSKPEPLPPPVVNRNDPLQTRAAAVGLNPGLSRVLLSRLTPDDYRNAGFAIKTAIAKTSDKDVFVWPRQRKPELALFKVHFVPGAPEDCRRYVVTISKDGWLTTALPMEKCGLNLARRNMTG